MAKKNETTESNYRAEIIDASREFSPKERVMYKDLGNATQMVDFARTANENDGKAIIDVADYAVIAVHNDATEDKDYTNYLLIAKNGEKYYTGSVAFWSAFMNIYTEMKDCEEPWAIQLNLLPSKNYKGKEILTCSLV